MNLKQLSHDIYHAARGDKCRVEDIEEMLRSAIAETLEDTTVKRQFCLNCEYEIGASSVICTHCGTPVPSDAEAWQHANDTVVMADMVRLGKENEKLRREAEESLRRESEAWRLICKGKGKERAYVHVREISPE